METKKYIGKDVFVKIDRPMGSKHPETGQVYPVNYGFIPGTIAPDGEEIDCYVLGVFEPIKELNGKCIAVIHRVNDNDDKLIVVPEGKYYTHEQIEALTEFQERYFRYIFLKPDNMDFSDVAGRFSRDDSTVRKAVEICIEQKECSLPFLCLQLRKGYGYPAALVVWLEGIGVVGPANGDKPREVLINSMKEFDELIS